jgi:hypothetical protein
MGQDYTFNRRVPKRGPHDCVVHNHGDQFGVKRGTVSTLPLLKVI